MEEPILAIGLEALFVRIRRLPARLARRELLKVIYPEQFVEPCQAAQAETTRAPGGDAKWLVVDDSTGEVLGYVEAAAQAYLRGAMKRPEYGGPEGVRDAS